MHFIAWITYIMVVFELMFFAWVTYILIYNDCILSHYFLFMLHFIAFLKIFMLHFIAFMFDILVANYPFYIAFYCSYFLTILEGVKIFDCILLQSDCKRCKRAFKVARRLKWTFFRVKLTGMIANHCILLHLFLLKIAKILQFIANFFWKNVKISRFFRKSCKLLHFYCILLHAFH